MGKNYEEWMSVSGYEGLYEVSNTGRVRNNLGQPIKTVNVNGYEIVWLRKDDFRSTFRVIDLIKDAFGRTFIQEDFSEEKTIGLF